MKKISVLLIALAIALITACTSLSSEKELTNSEKAVMVLKSLETGDSTPWEEYVSDETYIQHNLTFPDGKQTVIDALPMLREAGTTVEINRVFSDGDYVALQSRYNLFGEKAGFDIFRFEEGKIVEHWDNLLELAAPNPSGHTQLDGEVVIKDRELTEENRALVRGFIEDVLMGNNPEKFAAYFDGNNYIQHNPAIADGLDGLGAALAGMADAGIEMVYDKIHLTIAEGNFVLIVSEGAFAGAPTSYYDLFRIENGYIAEHWDVMETIIPESDRANRNGKF